MADQADKDQRTEEATPRRQEKLREEGKVAKSPDIGAAATLFASAIALISLGERTAVNVTGFAKRAFRFQDAGSPEAALKAFLPLLTSSVVPIMLIAAVVSALVGAWQTKWLFSWQLLMPKPERFNPLPGLKKIFPGKESSIEVLKSFVKIMLIGAVAYHVISGALPVLFALSMTDPIVAASEVGGLLMKMALQSGVAFAALSIADHYLAQRKFGEETKMTKQEVKDEHKQSDGDPHIKRRIRQRMAESAKRRAISDVKHATVLVTNPTHISVALRYDADIDAAPVVISMGIDDTALQMRAAARKHGIPIVENRPLARALHKTAKAGDMIPVDMYAVTAEIIAHVLRLRGGLS